MPRVSILIPAYRPDFLDACLASALAQTLRDIEIVVGDDCPGDDVARVLAKWQDPRLRYERNPLPRRSGSNRDMLIGLARGDYLKFLFDDDLLYPQSVQLLLDAAQASGAALSFHHRHFIDTVGRIIGAPTLVPGEAVSLVPAEFVYRRMLAECANPIGEPGVMLIDARALRAMALPFGVLGRPLRFLTDVALLFNFVRAGHRIAGVGQFGSALRIHPGQSSSASSPILAAGLFEWELLARCALAEGLLDAGACAAALAKAHAQYRQHLARLPLLERFLALPGPTNAQEALGEPFLRALDLSYFELDVRRLGAAAPAPAPA